MKQEVLIIYILMGLIKYAIDNNIDIRVKLNLRTSINLQLE